MEQKDNKKSVNSNINNKQKNDFESDEISNSNESELDDDYYYEK